VVAALEALTKAAQATVRFNKQMATSTQRMASLGFPGLSFRAGALIEAPFDFMSDTLRGMRGIFLDMMRIPDKLLAAEQKVLKTQVEYAVSFSQATGLKGAFIPLHRGSDGFMSLKQFEKFYWPQLKEMIIQLVNAGITPFVYYEGTWNQRLEYLTELPKGKTIGEFQDSDIFKVKEIVGETMCIMGGMPIPLLKNGTPDEIRERTKEVCGRVGKNGGFIMTSSVMELEGIRPESIQAWVDATKEFGVY
jgi:uroporphyrinogen-III decarboxylase